MPDASFDRILAGLYQAASGLEDWAEQWSRLARHLGARSSVAWLRHADGSLDPLASPGIDAPHFERYLAHYHRLDPYNIELADTPLSSEEVIGNAAYLETEFYRDFVRTLPMPTLYFMGFSAPVAGGGSVRVGFQRAPGLADFDARDKARLSPLIPHLPGMLQARAHLRMLADRSGRAHAMLDELEDALLCVDRDGRVLFRNRAALMLCDRTRLVEQDGGGRTVLAPITSPPLCRLVRGIAAGGPGHAALLHGADGPTHGVTLTRLESLPDGVAGPARAGGGALVLIRLRALSVRSGLARSVRTAFGLTGAETAVALRLSDGEEIAAIAAERSVSVHTVRTQVRMILDKSGTRTLRDFVRIVARL